MRIILNEEQFRDYVRHLNEESRALSGKEKKKINKSSDDIARKIYGKHYGKDVGDQNDYYQLNKRRMKFDADVPSGLFSWGNAKLSSDTLIINFNSALGCPSVNMCPVTQQACYAVAGENRLPDTRRKHLIVQNLVNAADAGNKLGMIFDLARLYVETAIETGHKPKYIRYNEDGDFKNQRMLESAARFSKEMRDEYGIMSMAYTANKGIDPSAEIDGEPIDTIIKMNRSREDIRKSEGAVDQKFFGIEMPSDGFSADPNVNLDNAYCDVTEVTDNDSNKLGIMSPVSDENGNKSIPRLRYGKWSGGEGWYYVCPCSFWKYNKDKAYEAYMKKVGKLGPDDAFDGSADMTRKLNKTLSPQQGKVLRSLLNKIVSPCGTKCAVCHNMSGGICCDGSGQPLISGDGSQLTSKDFTVLTATHGANKDKYNAAYAETLRQGGEAKYSEKNPHGKWNKYEDAWNKTHDKRPVMPNAHQMAKDNEQDDKTEN